MQIGNATLTMLALGGIAAGGAIGYGQSRLVAAHTAETPGYVASQVGAGVIGGGLAAGAAYLGAAMLLGGGFGGSNGLVAAGAAVGVGALGLLGGTLAGMVHEQTKR